MSYFLNSGISDPTSIVITLGFVIVIGGLGYLLYRSIIKTYLKEKEEKQMRLEGVITKSEMNSLISTYISRTGGESVFSLIYIDLDKFDDFAVAFGTKETRTIIKKVSTIIKQSLPTKTFLSRYKGDEFLIFIPSQYGRNEVIDIATSILNSFREKITVFDGAEIDLTASIAVAQFPHHGESLNTLLQSLQLSIHHIKKDGGNNLKVYTPSLDSQEEEMNYYYQIKRAISERQFMMYYQPMINIESKEVYAFEALLRWEHPELGVLAPNKFINIMEQTGDIHWVGLWGLETIVKKYIEFRQLTQNTPYFSINLSPKQLMNSKIAEEFSDIIKKYKVDPNHFILEIGEFLIFEKQQVVFENIVKLKKANFRLAIDEFGIDIASFDQVEKMGIDIFKIDYRFISEDSYNVNKYMEFFMDFVNKNKKIVICQGIEDQESEKRVEEFNISKGQGYFYSKPLNEKAMYEFNLKEDKEIEVPLETISLEEDKKNKKDKRKKVKEEVIEPEIKETKEVLEPATEIPLKEVSQPEAEEAKEEAPLESLKVVELKELAKEKGITGYSSLRKAELIEALKKENL